MDPVKLSYSGKILSTDTVHSTNIVKVICNIKKYIVSPLSCVSCVPAIFGLFHVIMS